MLMPKAAIRIVQCSAGAGSWRGNEKIANRRQQQQKRGWREESKKAKAAVAVTVQF